MGGVSEPSQTGVNESEPGGGGWDEQHENEAQRRRRLSQRWSAHRGHFRSLLGIKCARKTSVRPSASTPSATSTKLTWDGPAGKSARAESTIIHPPTSNRNPVSFMENFVHYSSGGLHRDSSRGCRAPTPVECQ